jgi:NTP pyrophosphatase (non-canonical NTP hydrolase)
MVEEMLVEQALQGIDPVLAAVRKKREEQIKKWGTQEHEPKMWYAILGEEFGEVGKEIAEGRIKPFDFDAYRKECLHTAAVALAMVQCLDDGIA